MLYKPPFRKYAERKMLAFPRRGIPLHVMISSAGFQKETEHTYDWHGLKRGKGEFSLFLYTTAGLGALVYEGARSPVRPGQAMIVHVPHDHRYYLPPDSSGWEFMYLCIYGREAFRLMGEVEKRCGPLVDLTYAESRRVLETAAGIIDRTVYHTVESPFTASALAYEFVTVLTQALITETAERTRPDWVHKVIGYCREHLREPVSIDRLASAAGYSRYHFTRLFTLIEGISPGRYLQDLRVKAAASELVLTRKSVKEVAVEFGFHDTPHFCKTFTKIMGITPGAFRRK